MKAIRRHILLTTNVVVSVVVNFIHTVLKLMHINKNNQTKICIINPKKNSRSFKSDRQYIMCVYFIIVVFFIDFNN